MQILEIFIMQIEVMIIVFSLKSDLYKNVDKNLHTII